MKKRLPQTAKALLTVLLTLLASWAWASDFSEENSSQPSKNTTKHATFSMY